MKITVLIHRQTPKEPSEGTLKAYIVQSGKRGPNLLKGKQFTSVDSAIEHADKQILERFRNSDFTPRESAREDADERHICPLQLQVIERGIENWSNPGDIVLSPYAGIGSEGYVAVRSQRRFVGIELKRSYYEQARKNLLAAEQLAEQTTLFAHDSPAV